MKKLFLLASLCLFLSNPVLANSITKNSTHWHDLTANQDTSYQITNEIVRAGDKSQKFILEHGSCGTDNKYSDCNNDSQRTERFYNHAQKLNKTYYYAYSIYMPDDWIKQPYQSEISLGQVKPRSKYGGNSKPLWIMKNKGGMLFVTIAYANRQCVLANELTLRGKWSDIVIKADYSWKQKESHSYFKLWLNGKLMCDIKKPLFTKEILKKHMGLKSINSITAYFSYGIYHNNVSQWLDYNKTKSPKNIKPYVEKESVFKPVRSIATSPFDHDWGVELPTRVIYYDEMRISNKLESVQINQNKPVD